MFAGILDNPVYDTCADEETVPVGNPVGRTYDAVVDVVALPNSEPVYELADTFPCIVTVPFIN